MSKKVVGALVFLVAVAIGGYVYLDKQKREQAIADYPVRLLEAVIQPFLVSSTTYKRLESSVVELKDGTEALVSVKFTSQNRLGAMLDSEALMKLIPEYVYMDSRLRDRSFTAGKSAAVLEKYGHIRDIDKRAYETGSYKTDNYFYKNCRIELAGVNDQVISKDNLAEINDKLASVQKMESIRKKEENYPYFVPEF